MVVRMDLKEGGQVQVSCNDCAPAAEGAEAAWRDVFEVSLPVDGSKVDAYGRLDMVLRIGRDGTFEHEFGAVGVASAGG
jgi:hypothetical protein